jgi:5-methylthioadenosine/S-adenosylhomocysteine deaminase
LIVHLTVAQPDEIALLVQHAKTAALNPRANASLGLPLPPVAELLQAGANLLLGTDNGMLNSPSLLAELDFTYKIARSQFANSTDPEPRSILKMVTSNIRPVLGGDHYGYLDEKLPASFVALNFHQPHLSSTRNLVASILTRVTPADVLFTCRQGRELWRDPAFTL